MIFMGFSHFARNWIFGFFNFVWAGQCVGRWIMAEMKENCNLHILIPMWVFKMVCKTVYIHFEVFLGRRRRARRRAKIIFSKVTDHSSIPSLSDAVWAMRYESWEDPLKHLCAKSSDFTGDQSKLVPWCDCWYFNMIFSELQIQSKTSNWFSGIFNH